MTKIDIAIHLTTGTTTWTDFEKTAWEVADTEHYGQAINWDSTEYHLTATKNDQIIGSIRFTIRAGVAYIDALIVDPEFRGQGIATKLLQEMERIAREKKAHKIYVQTGKSWGTASLYQKQGYAVTSELPNHYVHVDFLELTKFLDK